jgi:TatD DNase family protein
MKALVDSHCHLQDKQLFAELDSMMERAASCGIDYMVCCGTEEADWPVICEIKKRYPQRIIPSFGLHPWYLKGRSNDWLGKLDEFLNLLPSGVGECGLDFALSDFDQQEQEEVFLQQLELAKKYQRPVSIHCRRAWDALIAIFEKNGPFTHGGLVHSYSGGPALVPEIEKWGLSISFSGSITRSRNAKGKKSLAVVSPEHRLIETDSPDILPAGVEGINEPCYLTHVVDAVASLLNQSPEEVGRLTTQNALRIFGPLI